jgi:hypothetical protein
MMMTDAAGKPLRFPTPADERAWIRAHSGAVAGSAPRTRPPAAACHAAAERVAVKALIVEAEAELGCPILDDDGTRYLKSARRRGLSGQQVATELGTFLARQLADTMKGDVAP